MAEMMKEVVVVEPHKYEVREVEIPELANEDEVLIQMKSAGVCGSDHHIWHGSNPCSTYPRIPGHENAGVIAKIGKNVKNVKVGDHVIVDLLSSCGTCYQCTHGRKNVCEHVKVRGSGADGGWRQYFTAPAKEVYKISDSVKWEDAALVEPFAIGSHCTGRGRVVEDDVVFILGTGTIGSIILQTCKAKGCKTVICCDISDSSLERAKEYGADYVINSKTQDVVAEIQKITDGHGCTVAFDSACFPGSLTMCLQPGILCNAGRMVPMGFCTEKEGITQAMINQRELDIIGSRMSQDAFEPTIARMEKGEYITEGIATTFIKFSEIDKVYDVAKGFCDRGFKCHGVKADFSKREQVYQGFNDCVAALGGDLDIIVNAHGIQRRHSAEVFPIEEWDEVLNVNLNSVFILCQEAAKIMLKKGYGKIINIASMVSWFGGQTVPAYTAAKGGVTQLTKELSNDWIARGVNVNAIAPGYMATEMNSALLDPKNPRYQQITERIPANRWGTGDDMKGACIFLASHASDYLGGAIIPVDGGYLVK